MKNKSYLIVHKDYSLSVKGVNAGAEMATLFLARYLVKEGCRVVIAAELREGEEQVDRGVEFWDLGKGYDVRAAFTRAERELGQYHLISSGRALAVLMSGNYPGCQSRILISHDRTSNDTGISAAALSAAVDKIVCVSEAQREFFIKDMADPTKVTVVHNGVDQEMFPAVGKEARNYKRLVFAGALVQDKGIHFLIESFAQLKQKHPDIMLDVYGSAQMWGREPLFDEKEIASQLPGLTFHGAVDQSQISQSYQEAGIAVVPSIWFDPFPLTSIEAQVTGCPVVTFNVGGLGEGVVHGVTGSVLEEISVDALTRELDRLLSNPEILMGMTEKALEIQRPRYTWERVACEIMRISAEAVTSDPETGSTAPFGILTTWNQQCGLATYANYLFSEMDSEQYLVLAEDTPEAERSQDQANVVRCWSKGQTDWTEVLQAVREHELKLLHLNIHNPLLFPVEPFVRFVRTLQDQGCKVVLHLHSIFTERPQARALFEAVDAVLVHSPEARLEAVANGADASTTFFVPHGIDVKPQLEDSERYALRNELGFSPDEKAVVCFGFVQPHKGIEELITSVKDLRAQGLNVCGYVAGRPNTSDPNSLQYLKSLRQLAAEQGVMPYVKFIDTFLRTEEVTRYLQAADVVLMNYRSGHYEASGACSLALGAGALVATSLAPPFVQYGDAVWHISSGFPVPHSLGILLSNEPLQQELRTKAQAYAQEHCWPKIARKVLQIYKELGFHPGKRKKENVEVETKKTVSSTAGLKVLIQNRSNMYTHRGGDTVVVDKLVTGLQERGVDVKVDLELTEDPKDYHLVHLINFAMPQMVEVLGKRAKEASVPFVVTTLCEDIPTFHEQSIEAARALVQYVQVGQDREWLASNWKDPSQVPGCAPFDNSWAAQNASALLVNGEEEARVLQKTYGQTAPVVTIPLGYEVSEQDANPTLFEREYGVKDFIFCVGRFESRKNQLMLLKALEDVDLPVVFASGGFSYQADYFEAVSSYKRKGETLVLERLSPEMLASAYAAAKVHVLPSWYELPGLVSLEAAYYGCNVVVTENGTAKDYFKERAYYCDPASEHSVRNAVLAAYYSPVDENLKTIVSQYTWSRFAENTLRLYESLAPVRQEVPVQVPEVHTPVSVTGGFGAKVPGAGAATGITPAEALTLIDQGQEAAREGDFARAHELLSRAGDIAPNELRVYRNRAAVYMAEGNAEQAEKYFVQAHKMSSEDPRTLSGLGMCAMMREAPEEAYPYFVRALAGDPFQMVAIMQLMECSYKLERFEDLHRVLVSFVERHPEEADMRYCLAGCLFRMQMYAEAEQQANKVLEQKTEHRGAKELLVELSKVAPTEPEVKQKGLDKQIIKESIDSLIEKRSGSFDSLDAVLAELEECKKKRQYEKVMGDAEELLKNPALSPAQKEQATLLFAEMKAIRGEVEEARRLFNEILGAHPQSTRAICGVGALEANDEDWNKAQSLFEKALSIDSQCDVALAGLGLCAGVAGDESRAWEYYQQAFKMNPENTRALYGIIEIGYSTKNYTGVERALEEYLEYHPADLNFLYSLAGCYFAQDKLDEALSEVQKVLIFDKENVHAQELVQAIQSKKEGASSLGL